MVVGPDTRNEKGVKTKYPVVEGLTAETTKQTGDKFLGTRVVKSNVKCTDVAGIYVT